MAGFLGTLLAARDQPALLTSGLQLVELLLIKKPDTYHFVFRREGVMHEVEQMADEPLLAPPKSSSSGKKTKSAAEATAPSSSSNLTRALRGEGIAATTTTALTGPEAQAKDANTLRARHIRDKYVVRVAETNDAARRAAANLADLRTLAVELDGAGATDAAAALTRIADLFRTAERTTSSFEMLESGLVGALLRFASDGADDAHRRLLWTAFAAATEAEADTATAPLANLVKRLQESMSRLEDFAIVTAHSSSSSGGGSGGVTDDGRRASSSASMLARQLKLRLIGEGTDIPRSCSNVIVSIHAIATFQAFNDYLRPRIVAAQTLTDRAGGAFSAPAGVSGALAAFAAAAGLTGDLPAAGPSNPSTRLSQSLEPRRSARLESKASDEPPCEPGEEDDDGGGAGEDEGLFGDDLAAETAAAAEDDADERPVNLEVAADGSKVEASTPEGTRVSTPRPSASTSTSTPAAAAAPARPTPPAKTGSYAAAVKREPTDFHLEFSMGETDVPLDTTIYGAVHAMETRTAANPATASRTMWNSIHTVRFRKVAGPASSALSPRVTPEPSSSSAARLGPAAPESIAPDSRLGQILQLLRVLHILNADPPSSSSSSVAGAAAPVVTEQAFINNKLASKLNRQLEEPMIVASSCLPDWALELPSSYPFLFPFTTRLNFLQSTSFGYARLLNKWTTGPQQTTGGRRDDNLGFLGRLTRQKVRISRSRMLESAVKVRPQHWSRLGLTIQVFELYAGSKAALEVEYFEEVGTGLGPTLEFYSIVSQEFQRKDLALWREGDGDAANPSAFVFNPQGLFPSPLPADAATTERGRKVLAMFRVLGQFIAKSLMDSRIVDLPFNREFMRLVLDPRHETAPGPASIATVRAIDRALARSLKHVLAGDGGDELDFTLPGHPSIELRPGGAGVLVTPANAPEYVRLVCDYVARTGVASQVRALRDGFSTVFPVRDLRTFTPDELVLLFGNADEDWSAPTLLDALRADHGFTADSRSVRNLVAILAAYDAPDRRAFLQFITGSPKLPVGGFAALSPPLTIVRLRCSGLTDSGAGPSRLGARGRREPAQRHDVRPMSSCSALTGRAAASTSSSCPTTAASRLCAPASRRPSTRAPARSISCVHALSSAEALTSARSRSLDTRPDRLPRLDTLCNSQSLLFARAAATVSLARSRRNRYRCRLARDTDWLVTITTSAPW